MQPVGETDDEEEDRQIADLRRRVQQGVEALKLEGSYPRPRRRKD
jgi:hypothetical protein